MNRTSDIVRQIFRKRTVSKHLLVWTAQVGDWVNVQILNFKGIPYRFLYLFVLGGLKVRFVDSAQNFSGRVQVYKDGSWGELCSSDLSDNEANVLCSMAGFK